jgi:hypothetical protein
MKRKQPLGLRAAGQLLAERYSEVRTDRKSSKVERFVVKGTKRKAILLDVGPSRLVPLNMGGFDSDQLIS